MREEQRLTGSRRRTLRLLAPVLLLTAAASSAVAEGGFTGSAVSASAPRPVVGVDDPSAVPTTLLQVAGGAVLNPFAPTAQSQRFDPAILQSTATASSNRQGAGWWMGAVLIALTGVVWRILLKAKKPAC